MMRQITLACNLNPDEALALAKNGIVVPVTVPWDFVEPHEERAQKNGVTIEHIKEGLLTPADLLLLKEDLPRDCIMRDAEAVPRLLEHIRKWRPEPPATLEVPADFEPLLEDTSEEPDIASRNDAPEEPELGVEG